MPKKLLVLLLAFTIIIIGIVVFQFIVVGRSPKQGVLKVTANTTSKVLLENREIGKTPFEGKVNVGEYALRLVPDSSTSNISAWQGNIKIGASMLTFVNRELSESELTSSGETLWLEKVGGNTGELSVTSVPDGSQVILNDQSKGITPTTITDLTPGDYSLVVSSPGFEPRTIKIKVTAGYKLTSSIFLSLSPSQMLDVQNIDPATSSATLVPSVTGVASKTTAPTPTPTIKQISPTPTKAASPTPTTKVTTKPKKVTIKNTPTGFLRVRKEASTAGEEVGRVKPGEEYAVLDMSTQGGSVWYKITFSETQDGWISGDYADPIN